MSNFLSCALIEDWESLGACLWLTFRYVVVIVGLSLDGRGDIGKSLDWELRTLRCAFVALHNSRPLLTTKEWPPSVSPLHVLWEISCDSIMLMLLGVATSESMKPRPCFHHCNTICALINLLHCRIFLIIFRVREVWWILHSLWTILFWQIAVMFALFAYVCLFNDSIWG